MKERGTKLPLEFIQGANFGRPIIPLNLDVFPFGLVIVQL